MFEQLPADPLAAQMLDDCHLGKLKTIRLHRNERAASHRNVSGHRHENVPTDGEDVADRIIQDVALRIFDDEVLRDPCLVQLAKGHLVARLKRANNDAGNIVACLRISFGYQRIVMH